MQNSKWLLEESIQCLSFLSSEKFNHCSLLSPLKDAHRFGNQIKVALRDLLNLLDPLSKEPSKKEESKAEVKKEK